MKKILILLLFVSGVAYAARNARVADDSADDIEKIESIQKEIESLNFRIEKLEYTISLMQQQTPAKAEIFEDLGKEAGLDVKNKKVISEREKQEYDIALSVLKSNDVKGALDKFEAFIAKYPDSQLLSSAYFWYGETLFREEMYDKSALQYLKSYKIDSKGAKASNALLNVAFSLNKLNKIEDACSMLNKLDNEFQNLPAASLQKAQYLRTQIKCK